MNSKLATAAAVAALSFGIQQAAVAGGDMTAPASSSPFYVSANVGAGWAPKVKFQDENTSANYSEVKQNTGVAAGLAVGYRFDDNFRADISARYHTNSVDTVKDEDGAVYTANDSKLSAWTFLGNVYYDFDAGMDNIKPFVGLGLGVVKPKLKEKYSYGGTSVELENSGDAAFAYAATVGMNYQVNSQVAVTADYRYIGSAKSKWPVYDGDTGAANGNMKAKYQNHSVNVGLTYSFS